MGDDDMEGAWADNFIKSEILDVNVVRQSALLIGITSDDTELEYFL